MLTNDATILKIKHEVLYEVAKLAYSGEFDDKKEDLPYKMIPGDRKSTRLNSSHWNKSRMPSSA